MANLERSEMEGVTVLRLHGSLNQVELRDVEKAFHDATHGDASAVIVDLTNVDFLTTPAITMFLEAAHTLKHTGGKIGVTGPQPKVGDILKRLRLETMLPVYASVQEGIQKVKRV
jgi:anti-anti-sigma factor